MDRVIAISTDINYLTPVETLIKSIAYNNHDVKIYVINENIPQEWFINLNHRLNKIGIQVQDAKFDPALIEQEKISIDYLSKMAYGRILIPDLIPDLIPEDRVLYLDADIIVDGSLDDLFNLDLKGKPVAAATEYFDTSIFNSGVLLMDNAKLRDTNFVQDLLERGKNSPADNDQTLLNEEFENNYLPLKPTYNAMIGGDLVTFFHRDQLDMYERKLKEAEPYTVIHYTTSDKPWNVVSCLRMRDKWWQYRELEYNEIVNHDPLPSDAVPNKKGTFFTFTDDENVESLYDLATAMPEYEFNVAAYTMMGSKLVQALKYPNVRLYPSMTQHTLHRMLNEADIYLDINHGPKTQDIIKQFIEKGDPVLTFDDVKTNELTGQKGYESFKSGDVKAMVKRIKELIAK